MQAVTEQRNLVGHGNALLPQNRAGAQLSELLRWEYKILNAADLEFGVLHTILRDLGQRGWRLERVAVSEFDSGCILALLLKRELETACA